MLVPVILETMFHPEGDSERTAVCFQEKGGERRIVMVLANSLVHHLVLAHRARGSHTTPMLHAAVVELLAEVGITVHHVELPPSTGGHKEIAVHFQQDDRTIIKLMRPSDALAIAAYTKCLVLAEESLLVKVTIVTTPAAFAQPHTDSEASEKEAENEALNLPKDKLPQA